MCVIALSASTSHHTIQVEFVLESMQCDVDPVCPHRAIVNPV